MTKLINLIDKKIAKLREFNEITSLMLNIDTDITQADNIDENIAHTIDKNIDTIGNLLDEREAVVKIIGDISNDIKEFVDGQSPERQEKIKMFFKASTQKSGYTAQTGDDFLMLQDKFIELEAIKRIAQEADKKAYDRIYSMQQGILSQMTELKKTKKVIDYLSSQTSEELSKGAKLNVSN